MYVANALSGNVTVIDGTTNSTQSVPANGAGPFSVAVNPVTLAAQRFIDVVFESRTNADIDPATINGDEIDLSNVGAQTGLKDAQVQSGAPKTPRHLANVIEKSSRGERVASEIWPAINLTGRRPSLDPAPSRITGKACPNLPWESNHVR